MNHTRSMTVRTRVPRSSSPPLRHPLPRDIQKPMNPPLNTTVARGMKWRAPGGPRTNQFSAALLTSIVICACGSSDSFVAGGADASVDARPPDASSILDGTPGVDGGASDDAGGVPDPVGAPDAAPPGCDPTKDPKDAPLCVTDSFAFFVDGSKGADTNAGTKAAPLKTIAAAIGKASTIKRIYICEGSYPESATLLVEVPHDGLGLYGGWRCSDWSYSGTKPKVSTSAGYVLRVASIFKGLAVQDLELDAPPGSPTSPSSIAVFVQSSPVVFTRVRLVAGVGAQGINGVTGSNYDMSISPNDPRIAGHGRWVSKQLSPFVECYEAGVRASALAMVS
jgi:hypothetical protein